MGRTPKEVQLAVRGRTVTVSRTLVELRDTPPSDWTVVHPAGGRDSYMVCPACRHRAQLPERHVDTLRCPRCNAAFGIAWGAMRTPSLPAEVGGLKPDRRLARRRTSAERRAAGERRTKARGTGLSRRNGQRRAGLDRRRQAASR